MYCIKEIKKDTFWVGGNDRRLALFENAYPIPRGISYNAYLVKDEKNVLLDTVDKAVSEQFFENLSFLLGDEKLDYLIINHMEPDHCANIENIVLRYPDVKIVGNQKTMTMIKQFFDFDIDSRALVVKEGDTLSTGKHTFSFAMAPMVHWPEAMVTYDATDKVLYSSDAFGTFGAINGNIFADEVDFERDWLDDARRYYTNIVGKYGPQVQALLKKMQGLEVEMVCPLHGPVWRKNIPWFVEKYEKWSTYTPEKEGVMIVYGSIYGNTENAANILAFKLGNLGIRDIAMYDVSSTHPSEIVSQAFKYSNIVFASSTYNNGIFSNMETVLLDLKAHNLQNRNIAIIQNGTWVPSSGKLMREIIESMKNMTIFENSVTIKSSLKNSQAEELDTLANAIAYSINSKQINYNEQIENNAMFKLSYGLFVLTAKDGDKDNGCITNTVMQVTNAPKKTISIAINKNNFTHDLVLKTGLFNVSILTQEAPFETFQHFGFQSGKTVDKFDGYDQISRSENGLVYLNHYTNSFISAKVISAVDYGSHTLFTAEVTQAQILSDIPSVTYEYYFANIKPSQKPKKKGFVCKICGYVYEGDELPADFICPICKHGAEDFEPIG